MSKTGKIFTFLGIVGGAFGLISEVGLLFSKDEPAEQQCPFLDNVEWKVLEDSKSEDK